MYLVLWLHCGIHRCTVNLPLIITFLHWTFGRKNLRFWFLILRWNSWTASLVEVSGHKLESSQTRVFVWFSNLIFPFYKMLLIDILECVLFSWFLKPEKSIVFVKIRQKGLWIAWSKRIESFVKWCPRIPSLNPGTLKYLMRPVFCKNYWVLNPRYLKKFRIFNPLFV